MKSNLLITSTTTGVGKTTFTIALARKFRNQNIKVGYFKPISDLAEDIDSINAKEILGMSETLSDICPVFISTYEYDMSKEQRKENKEKILKSYAKLKENYDFLLIETNKTVNNLAFLGFSAIDLALMLDSKILMVASGKQIEDIDSFLLISDLAKSKDIEVIGGIMSIVPLEYLEFYRTSICPVLKDKHKIEMFGLVPDKSELVAPTVKEIRDLINAKVIAGKGNMDKLVEHYMIGAMSPESALKYFRTRTNKAVVTGGDRPQLAIAALETDTSVLILTGSIMPPSSVIAKAEERKIPVLLAAGDTFSTVKILTDTSVYGSLQVNQPDKIKAWDKILNIVNTDEIYKKLG